MNLPFTSDDSIMEPSGSILADVAKKRFFVFGQLIGAQHVQVHVAVLRFDDVRG